MKKPPLVALVFIGGTLSACTPEQIKSAEAIALDAICANVSTADMYFQSQVGPRRINASAQQAEAAAVAALQGYCDNRTSGTTQAALAAARAAYNKIALTQ